MQRETGPDQGTWAGLLVVDKPLRWSSMDVIREIRRAAGLRRLKVGHAGTLDPLATGVVLCCVGPATRMIERLMGMTKVYEADVDLSAFTTTDDREGPRQEVAVATPPTAEAVGVAAARFVGLIDQRPPAFSAVHVGGRRAYDLARRGQEVELSPRPVRIDEIAVLEYAWPRLRLRVTCGKGTYIRSLARDIGAVLRTGGHLAALRRTAVGRFGVEQAMTAERLRRGLGPGDLLPMEQAGEG